jgi:hypothetical protein
MKKGRLVFNENKYKIRYLVNYSSNDNERDRIGWYEVIIDPNFSKENLESLLNEEVEFVLKYIGYESIYAFIKLSASQIREIKINQIIENK